MTNYNDKTRELLTEIAAMTLETRAQFSQHDPEYDPNDYLKFILNLLNMVRQEGPVWSVAVEYVAKPYGLTEDSLDYFLDGAQKGRFE